MHLFVEIMAVVGCAFLVVILIFGALAWFIDTLPPGTFP